MLGCEDDSLHAAILQRLDPLVHVAVAKGRIEGVGRIIAVAPLDAVVAIERVRTVVDKRIGLHALPRHLILCRHRLDRHRRRHLRVNAPGQTHEEAKQHGTPHQQILHSVGYNLLHILTFFTFHY